MCSSSSVTHWPEQTLSTRWRSGSLVQNLQSLTFVQPVWDPVIDHALLSWRRQPPGAALNVCLVVDVVFKYVDLWSRNTFLILKMNQMFYLLYQQSFTLFIICWFFCLRILLWKVLITKRKIKMSICLIQVEFYPHVVWIFVFWSVFNSMLGLNIYTFYSQLVNLTLWGFIHFIHELFSFPQDGADSEYFIWNQSVYHVCKWGGLKTDLSRKSYFNLNILYKQTCFNKNRTSLKTRAEIKRSKIY